MVVVLTGDNHVDIGASPRREILNSHHSVQGTFIKHRVFIGSQQVVLLLLVPNADFVSSLLV